MTENSWEMVSSKYRLHYGWFVVAVGFILLLLMFGTRLSFGLYIKPLTENFGATRASISFSQSLYMVTYAIFALIAGSLADNYGPKRVLVAGSLFMGVGMLLASQITALWQYYLTYGIIVAIGSGAVYVPVSGAVSKFFTRQRNFALGITASGAGLGQYLIPPFMQKIVEVQGWQTAFFYTALLMLVFGVSLPWLVLRGRGLPEDAGLETARKAAARDQGNFQSPPDGDLKRNSFQTTYTLRQAMSTTPFWTYFTMYFIICFIMDGIVFVHLFPYLTDIGFDGGTAAKALGYLGLISTVAMVVLGPLGDRINKRIFLTALLAAHTFLLLWLTHIQDEFTLWGFIVFYGILLGAAWPLTVSILSDIFGSKSLGSILGACTIAFGIAGLVAPWVAGYIFDHYRSYKPIFYFTVFLSLASIVCAFYTRKPK